MASSTLGWMGMVVSDVVVVSWGGTLPTRRGALIWSEHALHVVPLWGATCRGNVYEASLGELPLCEALSLLHCCSF